MGNSLSDRSVQKQMNERKRKVAFVSKSLPDLPELEASSSINKYPITFLLNSTSEFVFGFSESSILSASFAAEYGLLIRLNVIMSQEEKQVIAEKRNGLGFSEAIKRSKGVLIERNLASELTTLCNLRNMSAHPSNWITLLNNIDNFFADEQAVQRWITKVTNRSPQSIHQHLDENLDTDRTAQSLENMKAYRDARTKNLPNLEWATHKKTLVEQTIFTKKHSEKLVKNMLIKKELVNVTSQPQLAAKYILKKYRFPEEMALVSIHTAHKTLKKLEMLSL
jgi:hypothetical protein